MTTLIFFTLGLFSLYLLQTCTFEQYCAMSNFVKCLSSVSHKEYSHGRKSSDSCLRRLRSTRSRISHAARATKVIRFTATRTKRILSRIIPFDIDQTLAVDDLSGSHEIGRHLLRAEHATVDGILGEIRIRQVRKAVADTVAIYRLPA